MKRDLRRRHRGHQGRGARLPRRAGAAAGGEPLIVDVGIRAPTVAVDVAAQPRSRHSIPTAPRPCSAPTIAARAVAAMGEAFATLHRIARTISPAIIGIGGGGGTSIVTAGMRALPIGVPKLMVSTLASGDVAPYVDVSDIAMMPRSPTSPGSTASAASVLANAAHAIAGMAAAR